MTPRLVAGEAPLELRATILTFQGRAILKLSIFAWSAALCALAQVEVEGVEVAEFLVGVLGVRAGWAK